MRGRNKTIRLFVGLYPPIDAAQSMLALLDSVQLAPHRLTSPQQVHLTVQFIGDRKVDELNSIWESVLRSAAGIESFELQPLRVITLPQRGRARLVAIETDAPPGLLQLHHRLVTRLSRHAREKSDDRFRPHFTLCRFRREAVVDRIDQPVDAPSLTIDKVMLMRSVLGPDEALHDEIDTVALV